MTVRVVIGGALLAAALVPAAAQAAYRVDGRATAGAGYQYSSGSGYCYYGIVVAGGVCSDLHGGDASASSGTIDPLGGDGSATHFTAAASGAGGGASGSSQTTADLRTASVHVIAFSANAAPAGGLGVVTGAAQSDATLNDVLHFTIAGASATTVTEIGVKFTIGGSIAAPGYRDPNYSPIGEVYGSTAFGSLPSDFYFVNAASNGYTTAATFNNYPSAHADTWTTNADHTLNVSQFTYDLVGASVDVPFYLNLTAQCRYGAVCNFVTGFALSAPTGVGFTSDSGAFLKGVGAVGGVPEPATWVMAVLGFGAIGVASRRKRRMAMLAA